MVERAHGKGEVTGSIPVGGSILILYNHPHEASSFIFLVTTLMRKGNLFEIFDRFLAYGKAMRDYRPQTLKNYKGAFELFTREARVYDLQDLNKQVVERWFFNGRAKRKWSPVTFRHNHKLLNVFFKWLVKENLADENYLDGLEKPRMQRRLPRALSAENASFILEASFHLDYRYKFERFRNRAIIAIMLFAGLRKGEVVNLKLNDVSMEERTIFIDQGKGGKDRLIPINTKLHGYLEEYLKDRRRISKDQIYLFLSMGKNKPLGITGINRLIKRLKKATRINFSAHSLRHSFATLMLEGGCDIYTLSKIMGHSKITTTTIYLSCSRKQMDKSIEMHALN